MPMAWVTLLMLILCAPKKHIDILPETVFFGYGCHAHACVGMHDLKQACLHKCKHGTRGCFFRILASQRLGARKQTSSLKAHF